MSYSNDQQQIRAGLVNYIGAMLASSKFDNDKVARHSVVAILLEEAMALCKDEDGYFDMYTCKPILRLVSAIAKQRANLMEDLPKTPEVLAQIEAYKNMHKSLEEILENTKI